MVKVIFNRKPDFLIIYLFILIVTIVSYMDYISSIFIMYTIPWESDINLD